MSATFTQICEALCSLEQQQFEAIGASFHLTSDWRHHLRGSIQSYTVDKCAAHCETALPVICTVGINYTQNGPCTNSLVRYGGVTGRNVNVARSTASNAAVDSVLKAYRRNRDTWIAREPKMPAPRSPLTVYGSRGAIDRIPDKVTTNKFILIMTNCCPFITQLAWSKQQAAVSRQLCDSSRQYDLPGKLYETLGETVDLWIGHAALRGTQWVWPEFAEFVRHRGIGEWLLTFNISPQAHLYFGGPFPKPGYVASFQRQGHCLYPWYQ